jgi:hypothetical protein
MDVDTIITVLDIIGAGLLASIIFITPLIVGYYIVIRKPIIQSIRNNIKSIIILHVIFAGLFVLALYLLLRNANFK